MLSTKIVLDVHLHPLLIQQVTLKVFAIIYLCDIKTYLEYTTDALE